MQGIFEHFGQTLSMVQCHYDSNGDCVMVGIKNPAL